MKWVGLIMDSLLRQLGIIHLISLDSAGRRMMEQKASGEMEGLFRFGIIMILPPSLRRHEKRQRYRDMRSKELQENIWM